LWRPALAGLVVMAFACCQASGTQAFSIPQQVVQWRARRRHTSDKPSAPWQWQLATGLRLRGSPCHERLGWQMRCAQRPIPVSSVMAQQLPCATHPTSLPHSAAPHRSSSRARVPRRSEPHCSGCEHPAPPRAAQHSAASDGHASSCNAGVWRRPRVPARRGGASAA
jgi:hypothetical protein